MKWLQRKLRMKVFQLNLLNCGMLENKWHVSEWSWQLVRDCICTLHSCFLTFDCLWLFWCIIAHTFVRWVYHCTNFHNWMATLYSYFISHLSIYNLSFKYCVCICVCDFLLSHAEQLVLYLKTAELLSTALHTAMERVQQGKLYPSATVKQGISKFFL